MAVYDRLDHGLRLQFSKILNIRNLFLNLLAVGLQNSKNFKFKCIGQLSLEKVRTNERIYDNLPS